MSIVILLSFPFNNAHRASQLTQQSIKIYARQIAKLTATIPVTKAGIQEHVLAIVAMCDLVSNLEFLISSTDDSLQPFQFIERPAVRGLIKYLNPKLQDTDIPKKLCITASVDTKVLQLEKITVDIVEVRIIYLVTTSNQNIVYPIQSVYRVGRLVHSETSTIHLL